MFEIALKAKIPILGVTTDDVLNVRAVLQSIAKKSLFVLPSSKQYPLTDSHLYWTEDEEAITVDLYRRLAESGAQCVIINPPHPSSLIFDAGELETPDHFLISYLGEFVDSKEVPALLQTLRGLSLKAASEIVQLTMARTGAIQPAAIRATRLMLGGNIPGLSQLDTGFDFYIMPPNLQRWLDLNSEYFLHEETPAALMPRGVMLVGVPGVGKSMAARVFAEHWKVPLYRLDVATSLNRYLGESERRVAQGLSIIERSAPCILLLDEVEKLFGKEGEEGTTTRILSQILWWLQEHRARVITVMTTNNIKAIPRELYRPGRIDQVIQVSMLNMADARVFAVRVFKSVMGHEPAQEQQKTIWAAIDSHHKARISHSAAARTVYNLIKSKGWLHSIAPLLVLNA